MGNSVSIDTNDINGIDIGDGVSQITIEVSKHLLSNLLMDYAERAFMNGNAMGAMSSATADITVDKNGVPIGMVSYTLENCYMECNVFTDIVPVTDDMTEDDIDALTLEATG